MTWQRCTVAGPVSAKKHMYTTENLMWGLRVIDLYHLHNMAIWVLEFLCKTK